MAARGTVWTHEETSVLIDLWSDDKIQALLESARHNHKVYTKLAGALADKGFELRVGKQCQDKIKKLKMKYREILDNNNRSGKGRKTWEFFEKMDAILGTKPTSRPKILLQSADKENGATTSDEDSESDADGDSSRSFSMSIVTTPTARGRSSSNSTEDSFNESMSMMDERQDDSEDDAINEDIVHDLPSASTPKTAKRAASDYGSKKPKKPKKNKTEKAVDSAIEKFTLTLKEMDDNFLKHEQERQKNEEESKEGFYNFVQQMEEKKMQTEEKMRAQDRDHEFKLFSMMMQVLSRPQQSQQHQQPHHMPYLPNTEADQAQFANNSGSVPNFSNYMPYSYDNNNQ